MSNTSCIIKNSNTINKFKNNEEYNDAYRVDYTPDYPISTSMFSEIVYKEFTEITSFIMINDKCRGIIPAFFSEYCHVKDMNSYQLTKDVNQLVSKMIKSDLSLFFDSKLSSKVNNTLNFPSKVTKVIVERFKIETEYIDEDDIDQDNNLINTKAGVLIVDKLITRDRKPGEIFFYCTEGIFVPDYTDEPEEFTSQLREVLSISNGRSFTDDDLGRFESYMSIIGAMIVAGSSLKKIIIEGGDSDTGKSTRHKYVKYIFGNSVGSLDSNSLIRSPRSKSDVRPELVEIRNKKVGITAEFSSKDVIDSKLLKSFSGSDNQNFRLPLKEGVYYEPKTALIISTNSLPKIEPLQDEAFFKRLIIIRPTGSIPKNVKDPNYLDKMKEPAMCNKVFTYIMRYASKYMNEKDLYIHPSFLYDKLTFLLQQDDPVSIFFDNCIKYGNHISQPQKYKISELYKCFNEYMAFISKNHSLTMKAFSKRFEEICEPLNIIKHNHDPKHGVYYDQFICFFNNNPQIRLNDNHRPMYRVPEQQNLPSWR